MHAAEISPQKYYPPPPLEKTPLKTACSGFWVLWRIVYHIHLDVNCDNYTTSPSRSYNKKKKRNAKTVTTYIRPPTHPAGTRREKHQMKWKHVCGESQCFPAGWDNEEEPHRVRRLSGFLRAGIIQPKECTGAILPLKLRRQKRKRRGALLGTAGPQHQSSEPNPALSVLLWPETRETFTNSTTPNAGQRLIKWWQRNAPV